MSSFETDADVRAEEEERRDALDAENSRLQEENKILLDALESVVGAQLGAGGVFPNLPRTGNQTMSERTDEILLLLLRAGRKIRAHNRVWSIPILPEDVAAVRAAGGFLTQAEYLAARVAK